MSSLTSTLIEEIKTAPDAVQREVFDFLVFLKSQDSAREAGRDDLLPLAPNGLGCRLEYTGGGRGMARFVSGEIVVVPFPFTDLSSAKVRPALVLASLSRGDVILCQITSQAAGHPQAVPLLAADFEPGGALKRASFALPHRLVTANDVCVRRSDPG